MGERISKRGRYAGLALAVLLAGLIGALSAGAGSTRSPVRAGAAARVAAESCPATDRPVPVSHAHGSAGMLVAPGARRVLLCRYSGLNAGTTAPFRLLAHRLIDAPGPVARLTRAIDATPRATGHFACPLDAGNDIVAIFGYPAPAANDPVTVDQTGCRVITNGRVTRAFGPAALLAGYF